MFRTSNFVSTCFCIAALLIPIGLQAQEEPEAPTGELQFQTFEDLVEVSEVFLDVLALDSKGQTVPGLTADDFQVTEDGQPVTLTSVSYYTTRYGQEAAASADEVPSSRYIVLFFHDQARMGLFGSRLMRQQLRAARDARRWVNEAMTGSDWVAVVSYDTELRLHQDFTQDPDALDAALKRVAGGKKPDGFRPGRREAVDRGRELGILTRLPQNRELRQNTNNVYRAIQRVAEASGFLVGRKVMMLYTVGFGVERSGGRVTLPDPRFYPELEPVLNDNNMAVYPIDMTPAGTSPPQEDFLQRLADDTGGRYDPNFTGFFQPLQRVTEENRGYYLLTYRSERPAGEIGYQNLSVVAPDPNIEVRARTGYRYGL